MNRRDFLKSIGGVIATIPSAKRILEGAFKEPGLELVREEIDPEILDELPFLRDAVRYQDDVSGCSVPFWSWAESEPISLDDLSGSSVTWRHQGDGIYVSDRATIAIANCEIEEGEDL